MWFIIVARHTTRILLVDDDADNLVCFRAALEHQGYQVDAFTDAKQALSSFARGRHDIILSDIKMARMSGFELARHIDSMDKNAKIILMTAFHMTKEEFDIVMPSTRIDAFIKKPIGMTKLLDHIEALAGSQKQAKWSHITAILTTGGVTSLLLAVNDVIPIFAL
jgi:DNA-binding response OmpR family regulator